MPITLRDVAARAGVTPTVVSRVLHNKAQGIRVSEATAERVRKAATDLGYRVNVLARNFRERQTMMIGVLHGIGFARPKLDGESRYFAQLMDGMVDAAFRHGYSVTLCPKLYGSTPEDAMADGRFDGLVWYNTVPSEENHGMLRACTAPLVLVHAQEGTFDGRFPIVTCDNKQGIELAVAHLVSLGHRRIAFAREGNLEFSESSVRFAGYVEAMARHGLPCGPCDVINADAGREGVDDYYAGGLRHTAIIAHNEELGGKFITRARHFGIDVPGQVSIVGFDSTNYCNELRPTLSAVHQPLSTIGERAIDMLVHRINEPAQRGEFSMISCGFDARESTGPVPA